MSPEDPNTPSGHLGNLSREQEICLKQAWAAILTLGGNDETAVRTEGESISAIDMSESTKIVKEIGAKRFYSALWASPISEHPDLLVLRFLRARKWDISRALIMLTTMIKWRIELDVDKIIEQGEEVLNKELPGFDFQMRSRKAYFHGSDKQNRPVLYIHVRIHEPKQQSFETLRTFTIYNMETGRMFLTPPTYQNCLVFDMTDFGLKNMDWPLITFLVKAFEAYYPEMLGTLVIHKAPWIFSGIWKVLRPLLDPVVAEKVVFTRTDEQLLAYIDAGQLPKELGGDEDWVFEYANVVEGENTRFRDEKAKKQWQDKRIILRKHLEEKTRAWIFTEGEETELERERVVLEYRIASIEADPYLRPRSVYHRHGNFREDGTVAWHYKSTSGDQSFGVPLPLMKQKLVEGSNDIRETDGLSG